MLTSDSSPTGTSSLTKQWLKSQRIARGDRTCARAQGNAKQTNTGVQGRQENRLWQQLCSTN